MTSLGQPVFPKAQHLHMAPPRAVPSILLSIVVPCLNEEETLPELERRLVETASHVSGDSFEIVLVNDGSNDGTWQAMTEMATRHPEIIAVDLSRNFGHQIAVTAGLTIARGERALIIDADLQDPPELLEEMMEQMDGGFDVVYGQRMERREETAFKKLTAKLFYRLINRLSDAPIPRDTGDFRLISRRVVDAFLSMPEPFRFVRGMIAWAGFRQKAVLYDRDPRFAGETKYPLLKMISFAIDGVTGFSTAPLRLALQFAVLSLCLAVTTGLYVVYSWLVLDVIRGWASVVATVLFFASVQLFYLSVIGEYLGRTYMQTKHRPLFFVSEIVTQHSQEKTHTESDTGDQNARA